MLFYEPLFLFLFFPVVFGLFLAVRCRAGARGAVLLAASLLFVTTHLSWPPGHWRRGRPA